MTPHFILYVNDQDKSTSFYSTVLALPPALHVPGMTEFHLPGGSILGIMPAKGIKRLLGDALPNPDQGDGVPRAELYLRVDDPESFYHRAVRAGAKELSKIQERDWGHFAGYCLDADGYVLAFAKEISTDRLKE